LVRVIMSHADVGVRGWVEVGGSGRSHGRGQIRGGRDGVNREGGSRRGV